MLYHISSDTSSTKGPKTDALKRDARGEMGNEKLWFQWQKYWIKTCDFFFFLFFFVFFFFILKRAKHSLRNWQHGEQWPQSRANVFSKWSLFAFPLFIILFSCAHSCFPRRQQRDDATVFQVRFCRSNIASDPETNTRRESKGACS